MMQGSACLGVISPDGRMSEDVTAQAVHREEVTKKAVTRVAELLPNYQELELSLILR